MRRPLPNGYELIIDADSKIKIIITDVIGEGGCCIAYKGNMQVGTSIPVVVKECYPAGLPLARTSESDYSIVVDDKENEEVIRKRFGLMQKRFREGIMSYDDVAQYNSMEEFFGYGQQNGTTYGFTLFSKGRILTDFVEERYLSLAEIAELLSSVCRSVYRFHRAGYLYLDCKPDNVFVAQGDGTERNLTAHVIDFDSLVRCDGDTCSSGSVHSYTKSWAAPEQLTPGSELSRLTDVFSVGAIFFWCLTGKKLYPEDCACGENNSERLIQIQNDNLDWRSESAVCSKANDVVIDMIKTIIENSLAIDWKDRERYNYPGEELLKMARDFENLAREVRECEKTRHNILPVSLNRFKYNSSSTVFRGRQEEINVLTEMCNSPQSFSWIGICGKGGSGKSRLAYELCSRMLNQYWLVYPPMHFSRFIVDSLRDQHANVLICLDYIKRDKEDITDFIRSVIEQPFMSEYKIRLVLIEREEHDVRFDNRKINEFCYHKSLCLLPMTDEQLCSVVVDYVANQQPDRLITENDLDLIVNTLKTVDSEQMRPVYALFIADAWINNKDLTHWDRDDALLYLLDKEMERLTSILSDPDYALPKLQRDKLLFAIKYLYALATYLGEINIDDFSALICGKLSISSEERQYLLLIMKEFGIMSDASLVHGWEPDIIGEYYCIRFFDELCTDSDTEEVKKFIQLVKESDFASFVGYSNNLYKDNDDVVCCCAWENDLRNVVFPKEIDTVGNKEFYGCTFLRSISFPGRVTSIGEDAFKGCTELETVTLPSSLEIIENGAFNGCERLKTIIQRDNREAKAAIIRIGEKAFNDCISLESFFIPSSTQKIGACAFRNCVSLVSITIPAKISVLSESSFAGCYSLQEVSIERNIRLENDCFSGCENLVNINGTLKIYSIGKNAFKNCTKLREFNASKELEAIGTSAFAGCTALSHVDLLESKITEIPSNLFRDCVALNECSLSDSIESIGDFSFLNCLELKMIRIGVNLKSIGRSAFGNCEHLSGIDLSGPVQIIRNKAFEGCSQLSEIYFGRSLEIVEAQAFAGCSKLNYSCFDSIDIKSLTTFCGFKFSSFSEKELHFIINVASTENVEVPDTVCSIENDCFHDNTLLESITIPASVTRIGKNAFRDCSNLNTISCPENWKMSLGVSSFDGCDSLSVINGSFSVTMIPERAFHNCCSLESIVFSPKLKIIGSEAFKGCTKLQHIRTDKRGIPSQIGRGAFVGCPNLEYPIDADQIKANKIDTRTISLEGFIFNQLTDVELDFIKMLNDSDTVIIPRSCISIRNVRFDYLTNAVKIVIPDTIKVLYGRIFKDCKRLETVVLPSNIKKIPFHAFEECKSLSSFEFNGHPINVVPAGVSIENSAFLGCSSLESIALPDDLSRIEYQTFRDCSSLVRIRIPDSIKEIADYAFSSCISLVSVENLENSKIESIGSNCFDSCTKLKSISLPETLTEIKPHAFKNCSQLKVPSTFIPDSVTRIGSAAFQGCGSLEIIRLPSGTQRIENYTFKECTGLREIIMPDTVEYIGQSSFYFCIQLSIKRIISSSLKELGKCAFAYCKSLSELSIPDGVTELPSDLFKCCTSLKKVHIPDHIESIPANCFKDCVSLIDVNMPGSLKIINVGAFRNCRSLTSDILNFPDELEQIKDSAFKYCDGLEKIRIPLNVTQIRTSVFEGCRNLKEVVFEHHISTVDYYSFCDCEKLESFPFQLVDTAICISAFRSCVSLNNPVFSDTLRSIGPSAFYGCNSIKEVLLPNSMDSVSNYAFSNNTSLERVVLSPNIDTIKKASFMNCKKLENVEIKSPSIKMYTQAFAGCNNLNYIKLPEDNNVYVDAFEGSPVEASLKYDEKINWYSNCDI